MKRNYLIGTLFSGGILALTALAAYAANASSSSFNLVETTAAAKGFAQSTSYKVYTSTGQPAPVEVSKSTSFVQQGGFIRHLDQGGWVLNLTGVPWSANERPYYKGAAVSQMILNYIRQGAGYSNLTQDEIYAYGHPATDLLEMNPADVDKALGHFDPYDQIVSNSYDSYDSQPGGNPYQGYNFTVDNHRSSEITGYLRNICHWMAYKVRQEAWWLNGPFVARPNTPAALPFYGGYNWVTVKGFAADQNPTPNPTNPFVMPNFTVYGFWFKDPQVNGIGQDTYKTAAESVASYFLPLATTDTFNGKLIQIAEPPPAESKAKVTIAPSVSKKDTLLQSGLRSSNGIVQMMAGSNSNSSVTCESLVESFALRDPDFKNAVKGTRLTEIITVRRLVDVKGVETGERYDLLPFGKQNGNGASLIFAVVRLGGQNAEFKEVSWVKNGQKYLKVNREEAIQLAWQNMRSYPIEDLEADTVWWPSAQSMSPFQPYWRIPYLGRTLLYVTQSGTIIRAGKIIKPSPYAVA